MRRGAGRPPAPRAPRPHTIAATTPFPRLRPERQARPAARARPRAAVRCVQKSVADVTRSRAHPIFLWRVTLADAYIHSCPAAQAAGRAAGSARRGRPLLCEALAAQCARWRHASGEARAQRPGLCALAPGSSAARNGARRQSRQVRQVGPPFRAAAEAHNFPPVTCSNLPPPPLDPWVVARRSGVPCACDLAVRAGPRHQRAPAGAHGDAGAAGRSAPPGPRGRLARRRWF
jgi:hypothetical protein